MSISARFINRVNASRYERRFECMSDTQKASFLSSMVGELTVSQARTFWDLARQSLPWDELPDDDYTEHALCRSCDGNGCHECHNRGTHPSQLELDEKEAADSDAEDQLGGDNRDERYNRNEP